MASHLSPPPSHLAPSPSHHLIIPPSPHSTIPPSPHPTIPPSPHPTFPPPHHQPSHHPPTPSSHHPTISSSHHLITHLEFNVPIGVHDCQVPRVKPPASKRRFSSPRVGGIPLHHHVAPQHHLAHALPVRRHVAHCDWVHDC
ncbi:unnamed protein product [Closterium sp. NIES-54]